MHARHGRDEYAPHLLHVGRLGCIYHAAACLDAHTVFLLFHPGGEKRRSCSPGRRDGALARRRDHETRRRKTRAGFTCGTRLDNGVRHAETRRCYRLTTLTPPSTPLSASPRQLRSPRIDPRICRLTSSFVESLERILGDRIRFQEE